MADGRPRRRVTAADWPDVLAAVGDWRVAVSRAGRFYVQLRRPDGSFGVVSWSASEAEALARLAEVSGSASFVRPGVRPAGEPAVVAREGRLRVVVPPLADGYRVEWCDPGGVWRALARICDRSGLLVVVLDPGKHSRWGGRVVRSSALRAACLALPDRPSSWWPVEDVGGLSSGRVARQARRGRQRAVGPR